MKRIYLFAQARNLQVIRSVRHGQCFNISSLYYLPRHFLTKFFNYDFLFDHSAAHKSLRDRRMNVLIIGDHTLDILWLQSEELLLGNLQNVSNS